MKSHLNQCLMRWFVNWDIYLRIIVSFKDEGLISNGERDGETTYPLQSLDISDYLDSDSYGFPE